MNEPAPIARRICLAIGVAFLLVGSGIGLAYYLYFRPMWSPEVLGRAARVLSDQSTPADALRATALQGHYTLLASLSALDAAIVMLLIACAAAGVAFFYVCVVLRKGKVDGAL